MSNHWRGEAPITIGGKERLLRFDHNALADLEVALGGVSIAEMAAHPSVSLVREAISVGLREQVTVRPKQVGVWMSAEPERYNEYVGAVLRSIALALRGPSLLKELDSKPPEESEEVADDGDGSPSLTGVNG